MTWVKANNSNNRLTSKLGIQCRRALFCCFAPSLPSNVAPPSLTASFAFSFFIFMSCFLKSATPHFTVPKTKRKTHLVLETYTNCWIAFVNPLPGCLLPLPGLLFSIVFCFVFSLSQLVFVSLLAFLSYCDITHVWCWRVTFDCHFEQKAAFSISNP